MDLGKVERLLADKEKYQKQLSVAEAKLETLKEQLKEMEEEVKETFGTTDISKIEKETDGLVAEAEKIIEKLQQ